MDKGKRQSNFELLRIFAIILVILFHVQLRGSQPALSADNKYFVQPIIYPRLLILEAGIVLGVVGNCLFILISGYFLNTNHHIDVGKIAKKLLLQLGFSAIVLTIAYAVWITFFKTESLSLPAITIDAFNDSGWFAGYYLFIIIIAKVFLNGFTAKLTRNRFRALLLTVFAVAQFGWTGDLLNGLTNGLRRPVIGIFCFLLGGYIAKYNPFKNIKTCTLFLTIAGAYGIRFLSAYNRVSGSIDAYIKSNSEGRFAPSLQGQSNHEIAVVILAVCLFELFRRWNVPYNGVINFIGKSTLMIFFIHYNSFYYSIYRNDSWMEALSESVWLYCLKWFKWTAITFTVGLAAFVLYTLLEKLLPRMRPMFVIRDSGD